MSERIQYRCMACPLEFTSAETSNAHHDSSGHNQTFRCPRCANALSGHTDAEYAACMAGESPRVAPTLPPTCPHCCADRIALGKAKPGVYCPSCSAKGFGGPRVAPTTPLPCPFCGSRPVVEKKASGEPYRVYCLTDGCCAMVLGIIGITATLEQWNRRSPSSPSTEPKNDANQELRALVLDAVREFRSMRYAFHPDDMRAVRLNTLADQFEAAAEGGAPSTEQAEIQQRLSEVRERVGSVTENRWYVDATCGDELAIRFAPDDDDEEGDDSANPGSIVAIVPPPNENEEASDDNAALIANAPSDLRFLLDLLSSSSLPLGTEDTARLDWMAGHMIVTARLRR